MKGIKDRIHDWLRLNQNQGIHLLQQLVQIPSTQGYEKLVQELVAKKLSSLDFDVTVWELDGEKLVKHPYFFSSRQTFTGSPNVAGVRKGIGNGRSIVLNGHVDVVPSGDRRQWKLDPYCAEVIDGKLYGRGATDMKGGNVALILAVEALQSLKIRLKGDIVFHSVIEEESGGAGTLDAVLQGYTADAAIIPEPTNLKIFPKQQGSKWFRLFVKGRTAHGGTRYHGVSAIEKSYMVFQHIEQLEKLRNARVDDPLYEQIPIPLPINIGKIEGGDWPSSVADVVKMEGRIGIAPNETIAEVQQELEQWIEKLATIDPWFADHPVEVEWFGARWLPGEIENDHPFMHVLTEKYEDVVGKKPTIEASPWGTDGGLLTQVGKVPSVVFGPGVTEMAHYPNEYIEIENILQVAEIIALTLIEWCGLEEGL
ncbi:peptidase [Desertibacillus haloalkaliphilus]|uniref:peptidase n=1 Tax=Desertibacillus haloalkaliphilus TaxID=1328930 RepID=UPI001C271B67|nr:peptidase [Desertibacillus haloalkaliphilus]MBU8909016.1 peptidase [Desertibacillus haloalkaliphilus]